MQLTPWKSWLGQRLRPGRVPPPLRLQAVQAPARSHLMSGGHALCLFSQLASLGCLWLALLSLIHSWRLREESGPSLLLDPVLAILTVAASSLLLTSWYRPRLRPAWTVSAIALVVLSCLAGLAGWLPLGPARPAAAMCSTLLLVSAGLAWRAPHKLRLATGAPLRRLGLLTGILGTLVAALGALALTESYRMDALRHARHFNHQVLHHTHSQTQLALAWLKRLSERWAALPAPPTLAFMQQELSSYLRDHSAFRELAVIEGEEPILVVEAPRHDYHPRSLSARHSLETSALHQALNSAHPVRTLLAIPGPHGLLLEQFYLPIIRSDVPDTLLLGSLSLDRVLDDAALRLPSGYIFRVRHDDTVVYQSAPAWPGHATHSGTLPIALDGSKRWRLDFNYVAPRPTPLAAVFPELIFLGGLIFTFLLLIAEELARLARIRATQLQHTTYHDALTHLPNRLHLEALLAQIFSPPVGAAELAIIMVDLDELKSVNDAHGYAAGDAVLTEAARRIRTLVADLGIVARFGADEFVVALTDRPGKQVESLCSRILRELGRPYMLAAGRVQLTATAGLSTTLVTDNLAQAQECLHEADLAMRQAKREDHHHWRRYTPDLGAQLERRLEIIERLQLALAAEAFELHYQPIVSGEDGRILGFEALLRWNDQGQPRPPASYLQLAEDSGLIVALSQWVIHQAAQHAAMLQQHGLGKLPITINISPRYFRQPEFIPHLKSTIRSAQLGRGSLAIEITEAALLAEPERAAQVLAHLHALDIAASIDDFGTGHFNLKSLSQLPIDRIKLDVSLVAGLGQQAVDTTLVASIIPLAHQLGLKVVAEGVETSAQYKLLQSQDCDQYQGYLFSPALPFDLLLNRLRFGWLQLELPDKPIATASNTNSTTTARDTPTPLYLSTGNESAKPAGDPANDPPVP